MSYLRPEELRTTLVAVAESGSGVDGVVQIKVFDAEADLLNSLSSHANCEVESEFPLQLGHRAG